MVQVDFMVVVVVYMVSINGLLVHQVDDVEGVHVVGAVGVVVAAAAIWVVVVTVATVVVAAVCVVDLTVAAVVAADAAGLLLLRLELLLLLLLQGLLLFVGHRCQAFILRSLIFPSIANTQKENKFRFLQKPSSPHHFQV